MTTYDSKAVAQKLVTILGDLVGTAQIGAPANVGTQLAAYVTMGSQSRSRKATGVGMRLGRFMVMFVYRVDKNETAAEEALMDVVDAFLAALDADLTLGGTAAALEADSQAADEPDYQLRAGREFREYPVVVTVTQYGPFEVNP
jgi:hypothetical protein